MNSGDNPDALADVPRPSIGHYPVNGTRMYAEVRGSGPAVLLIGAADEDAEMWRPVAERLSDRTVVTYDRRGTRRSGRDDWPGGGSAQHADDAAGLLRALGRDVAVVYGASAGGIVALQLALRHPNRVRRALIFEPGYFHLAEGGEAMHVESTRVVSRYLDENPSDWAGAVDALSRWAAGTSDPDARGALSAPDGKEWYDWRAAENAEALIREDIPMTGESLNEAEFRRSNVDFRFAHGTESRPMFRQIATRLAALRGDPVDPLNDVGHLSYTDPTVVSAYILTHSG
jgi:pimeloyl-ACP methyl ester carboxylesterase